MGCHAARRDIAVLDTAARQRRLQKYLDDLERDNYATQVPIDLSAFLRPVASTADVGAGRRKRARLDLPKRAAFKKSVALLVDESVRTAEDVPNAPRPSPAPRFAEHCQSFAGHPHIPDVRSTTTA